LSPDVQELVRDANSKYLHWDKFRHYPMPEGVSAEDAWCAVQLSRSSQFRNLPISFRSLGEHIRFSVPPSIGELLHKLDRNAGGFIGSEFDEQFSPDEKERYLISSLMEEAIASSQLEGAQTTREVAKKMLRAKRRPKTVSERMIVNNYNAILELRELKDSPLTSSLICHIQRVLTDGTLDNPEHSGVFRKESDNVCVIDTETQEVLHTPPSAQELKVRIQEICDLANESQSEFIHPIIVAIALHFAIGFVHPFNDGNGRTARALFYWYMLKKGYWLFEFLPISRAVLDSPVKYGLAYLQTETDGGDLTYFTHYNLRIVDIAIRKTLKYIQRHQAILRKAREMFSAMPSLNRRQIEVAYESVQDRSAAFDVRSHANRYSITRNTARADLQGLADAGIIEITNESNKHIYVPAMHLRNHILKGKIIPKEQRKSQSDSGDDQSTRIPISGQKRLFNPDDLERRNHLD